jgi:hypothetical protein
MPARGTFGQPRNAAIRWAELNGIVSDSFGHLYAVSLEARERLPLEVRGTGRLRPDSETKTPELALLMPGKDPRYAQILRRWDRLAERLVQHDHIIRGPDGRWRLETPERR